MPPSFSLGSCRFSRVTEEGRIGTPFSCHRALPTLISQRGIRCRNDPCDRNGKVTERSSVLGEAFSAQRLRLDSREEPLWGTMCVSSAKCHPRIGGGGSMGGSVQRVQRCLEKQDPWIVSYAPAASPGFLHGDGG